LTSFSRMESDWQRAQALLADGKTTCALVKGDRVHTSTLSGVGPMVHFLSEGTDLNGFSAADKIVGRAAAMLFVLAGVRAVYAPVMSQGACELLSAHGVDWACQDSPERIVNRQGTGPCPMEMAVSGVEDPAQAFEAIKAKLAALRAGQ
jgi:hypothetical protein